MKKRFAEQILKCDKLSVQAGSVKMKFMEHVLTSDQAVNHYTGLPTSNVLTLVYQFLSPSVYGENLILYNNQCQGYGYWQKTCLIFSGC